LKNLLFIGLLAGGIGYGILRLWEPEPTPSVRIPKDDVLAVAENIDAKFADNWAEKNLTPIGRADDLTVMRRIGLALTGSVPSLEEIRHFEKQKQDKKIEWWTNRLFDDRRTSAYLAERFARTYVGVEVGPFIIYRRYRMVSWLNDQFFENRPYDQLVRDLIAAKGIWTTHPEANFLTVTVKQNDDKKNLPDPVKLAARTYRAFLGIRIDCMQCHDDMFGDRWKQKDFHQLAAFFSQSKLGMNGIQEDPKQGYQVRYRGKTKAVPVKPVVPFRPDLLPKNGGLRERLAKWVTNKENEAFSRATVNRVWALLFNQPLVDPVDNIPLEGPYPPGLEILATDFSEHQYDLQRLIRIIVQTRVFQMASASPHPETNPVTELHEKSWAAFPTTRLRPEQVAGSIIQSADLSPIDADSHIIKRVQRWFQTGGFVKRFGDLGEDEFGQQAGTLTQRLLLMNGELIKSRTKENPFMNASTRIGSLTKDHGKAVETAYLTVLTRRPGEEERAQFTDLLNEKHGGDRSRAMQDIYWTLLNSTEFSWNH